MRLLNLLVAGCADDEEKFVLKSISFTLLIPRPLQLQGREKTHQGTCAYKKTEGHDRLSMLYFYNWAHSKKGAAKAAPSKSLRRHAMMGRAKVGEGQDCCIYSLNYKLPPSAAHKSKIDFIAKVFYILRTYEA
jgi:hypothetical protein